MLVTQSQSKIAEANLLQDQGNPLMRDNTSPSSPQWVHMGLSLHPLPLLGQTRANIKAFGAYVKSLKLSHKCR